MLKGTIDDIREILDQTPYLKVAWVFGSVEEDRARQDSDLDVAVLAEEPLSTEQKLQLIRQLAQVSGRPIDLIDLQASHGPIVGQVLHEGRRLFCRDNRTYAELMKRWMFEQADWMPYRRRIIKARRKAWIES